MAAEAASNTTASTQEATAAAAATRDDAEPDAAAVRAPSRDPGEGERYLVGLGVLRAPVVPYRRRASDPLYRRLRIYTVDPALPRLEGAVATIHVAFEPLAPGPVGQLFEVDPRDAGQGTTYRVADLDDLDVLLADGYTPSPSDPRFHQQMVYAVCSNVYSAFRTALGRNVSWGFGDIDKPARLVLRPHHGNEKNAYFSNHGTHGELRFGYFRAPKEPLNIRTMPGGFVFTCLSHDIVVHEAAHMLHYLKPAHFGLTTRRGQERFLDVTFRHRELFAYSCEAFSRVLAAHTARRERIALTETIREAAVSFPENELAGVAELVLAAARSRNGWRVIRDSVTSG